MSTASTLPSPHTLEGAHTPSGDPASPLPGRRTPKAAVSDTGTPDASEITIGPRACYADALMRWLRARFPATDPLACLAAQWALEAAESGALGISLGELLVRLAAQAHASAPARSSAVEKLAAPVPNVVASDVAQPYASAQQPPAPQALPADEQQLAARLLASPFITAPPGYAPLILDQGKLYLARHWHTIRRATPRVPAVEEAEGARVPPFR